MLLKLSSLLILASIFLSITDSFAENFPDRKSCYTIKNKLGQYLVFSDNQDVRIDQAKSSYPKAVLKKLDSVDTYHTWRFVKQPVRSFFGHSLKVDDFGFAVVNCETQQELVWDKDVKFKSKMNYAFLVDPEENVKHARFRIWRLVPKIGDNIFHIEDFKNKKYNLYSSPLKELGENLALVWTGIDKEDWVGSRNTQRLWKIEKVKDADEPETTTRNPTITTPTPPTTTTPVTITILPTTTTPVTTTVVPIPNPTTTVTPLTTTTSQLVNKNTTIASNSIAFESDEGGIQWDDGLWAKGCNFPSSKIVDTKNIRNFRVCQQFCNDSFPECTHFVFIKRKCHFMSDSATKSDASVADDVESYCGFAPTACEKTGCN